MSNDEAVVDGGAREVAQAVAGKPLVIEGRNGGTLKPIRSREQAAAMGRKRWEKAKRAIREGVRDAAAQLPDINLRSDYAMIRAIAESHSLNAFDAAARGSAGSAALILSAYKDETKHVETVAVQSHDSDDMRELLAAWRAFKRERGLAGADTTDDE